MRRIQRWAFIEGPWRRLRFESLEARRLLAFEPQLGTAWEEVWHSPPSDRYDYLNNQSVTASDFDGDGLRDLLVYRDGINELWLGVADGSFSDPIAVPPTREKPFAIDLDGDGDLDVISAASRTMRVVENRGIVNGTWAGFEPYDDIKLPQGIAPSSSTQLVAGDWNKDGWIDLAINTVRGILTLLGTEVGSFEQPTEYVQSIADQRRIVAVDSDLDGDLDLVSFSSQSTTSALTVFRNDGRGVFEPDEPVRISALLPIGVVAGDLDADGDLDLVAGYGESYIDGNVAIFLNAGDGRFDGGAAMHTVVGTPAHVAIGDLDSDGDLDVAVSHSASCLHGPPSGCGTGVTVLMNRGNGGFVPVIVSETPVGAMVVDRLDATGVAIVEVDLSGSIHILRYASPDLFLPEIRSVGFETSLAGDGSNPPKMDWNADGVNDVIELRQPGSAPLLGVSQPDGSYRWSELPSIDQAQSWTITELTGDGRADIGVITTGRARFIVLPQLPDGQVGRPVVTDVPGFNLNLIGRYDFNSDLRPDLLVSNGGGFVRLLSGTDTGLFIVGESIGAFQDLRLQDLNGDTRPDLTGIRGRDVVSLLSQPDGSFQDVFGLNFGVGSSNERLLTWSDFTGDGHVDMIVVSDTKSYVLTGRPDGTFAQSTGPPTTPSVGVSYWFSDVDVDGTEDVTMSGNGWIYTWFTRADGTLSEPSTTIVPHGSPHLHEDFNGDGLVDLILWENSIRISVLLGHSDGTFELAFDSIRANLRQSFVSGDFNADGLNDLMIQSDTTLWVWTRDRDGRFSEYMTLGLRDAWISWTGDINADGYTDLLVSQSDRVRVLQFVGQPSLSEAFAFPSGHYLTDVFDFTGDGLLDVVTTSYADGIILTVWSQNRDGTFSGGLTVASESGSYWTGGLDIDGDGWKDVIGRRLGHLIVWRNMQGRSLEFYMSIPVTGWMSADDLQFGDLNRDGRLDLVVANSSLALGARLTIMLSQPDGTWSGAVTYSFPSIGYLGRGHVDLVDVDRDGDLDVQWDEFDNPVIWTTDGERATRTSVILNRAAQIWPVGDANRDGRFDSADLVAAFQLGGYEDGIAGNSAWTEGDWNADGEFDSADIVLAFQAGTYVGQA